MAQRLTSAKVNILSGDKFLLSWWPSVFSVWWIAHDYANDQTQKRRHPCMSFAIIANVPISISVLFPSWLSATCGCKFIHRKWTYWFGVLLLVVGRGRRCPVILLSMDSVLMLFVLCGGRPTCCQHLEMEGEGGSLNGATGLMNSLSLWAKSSWGNSL